MRFVTGSSRTLDTSRESEEIGFGNSAINVWVQNADCEPVHCLSRS